MSEADDGIVPATDEASPRQPKFAACRRCKQLKVRCDKPHGSTKACERCKRAGEQCLPAPPSQQGKRRRTSEQGGKMALQALTPDAIIAAIMAEWPAS